MTLDITKARKMIEGDDAPNTEIMAYKVRLTLDVSVMAMQTEEGPNGKPFYSIVLYCPPDQDLDDDDEEPDSEACAELVYRGGEKITSLDEALRLLGIPPEAPIWVSEQ